MKRTVNNVKGVSKKAVRQASNDLGTTGADAGKVTTAEDYEETLAELIGAGWLLDVARRYMFSTGVISVLERRIEYVKAALAQMTARQQAEHDPKTPRKW